MGCLPAARSCPPLAHTPGVLGLAAATPRPQRGRTALGMAAFRHPGARRGTPPGHTAWDALSGRGELLLCPLCGAGPAAAAASPAVVAASRRMRCRTQTACSAAAAAAPARRAGSSAGTRAQGMAWTTVTLTLCQGSALTQPGFGRNSTGTWVGEQLQQQRMRAIRRSRCCPLPGRMCCGAAWWRPQRALPPPEPLTGLALRRTVPWVRLGPGRGRAQGRRRPRAALRVRGGSRVRMQGC